MTGPHLLVNDPLRALVGSFKPAETKGRAAPVTASPAGTGRSRSLIPRQLKSGAPVTSRLADELRSCSKMTKWTIARIQRVLAGGTQRRIVRVGNTIRIPPHKQSAYIADLLSHLERVGFDGAPRWLGRTQEGTRCSESVARVAFILVDGDFDPELAASLPDGTGSLMRSGPAKNDVKRRNRQVHRTRHRVARVRCKAR